MNDIETQSAPEIVRQMLEQFGGRVAIASSFGPEDMVLIDYASKSSLPYRVFTLDTDFLFPETYHLRDVCAEK